MILFIVGFLVGMPAAFIVGFYFKEGLTVVREILNRDPEPEAQVITPLPPGRADVNNQSAIVTPKSPDQLDREEQQRVRNLV